MATPNKPVPLPSWAPIKSVAQTAAPVVPKAEQQPPVPAPTTTVPLPSWAGGQKAPETVTVNYPIVGPTELGPAIPSITKVGSQYKAPPDITEARRALQTQARAAKAAGVPSGTVEYIVSGEKPNGALQFLGKVLDFDILGTIPKTNINIPGSFKPVKTLLGPLTTLDVGRRAILSTLKETGDLVGGLRGNEGQREVTAGTSGKTGFNFSDWLKQTNDPTIGYGKIVPSPTGNKWIDRLIGFAGDVALDPISYVSGPGGIAKTVETKAAIKGSTKLETIAANRTAALIARDIAADAAREAEAVAARVATDVAATAAEKATARTNAEVLKVAEQQANAALKKATGRVAVEAPRRTYGAGAREALAEQARIIRQEAVQVLDNPAATAADKAAAEIAVSALTDDVIAKIAADGYSAIRGAAKEVLGLRGGLRIFNPASVIGIGPTRAIIPGTEILTDVAGRAISKSRLGLVQTQLGRAVLDRIIPLGEGGLFGSEDVYRLRTGLRSGELKGAEATDAVQLLALDKSYRGLLQLARKSSAGKLGRVIGGIDDKTLNSVLAHLQTPKTEWAARGLAPLTKEQLQAYNAVKTLTDNFYKEASKAAEKTGAKLTRIENYFPRVQSQDALTWAAKNADEAARVAGELGYDKTWFLGNFTERKLTPGQVFFGRALTADDIAGGVPRLNQIAKESGIIDFNFFEEDVKKALINYANTHAKYMAYAGFIGGLPAGEFAGREVPGLAPNLATRNLTTVEKGFTKPSVMNLGTLENTIAKLTPEVLAGWSPAEMNLLKDDIAALADKLKGTTIASREFEQEVLAINETIDTINRLNAAAPGGLPPITTDLMRNELENYANALASQINNVKGEFIVTDPARWKSFVKLAEDGFTILNEKTIPDIAVRSDIAEMFQNVKRLDDPKFAEAADKLLNEYNKFFKAYVVATPGFHLRNALGNTFTTLAAGANPINATRGIRIYRRAGKLAQEGLGPIEVVERLVKDGLIKASEARAVSQALAYSGATGFGQFGEVAQAVGGGRVNLLGREAQSRAGEILGYPIWKSRQIGTTIEEANRFALLFDGLKKGYDPQTAAERASKYLIDYNDLSTLDRNIKQIVPFWMWLSRNIPLQIENMWMNPRAYAWYNSFRRNLEDKEGTSPYLPQYLKQQGAFKIPGTGSFEIPGTGFLPGRGGENIGVGIGENVYLNPNLGFPGAGGQNPLEMFIRPTEQLGRLTPVLKLPLEILSNQKFFSGAPITTNKDANPVFEKFVYGLRQAASPLSPLSRLVNATPARRFAVVQAITGVPSAEDASAQELQSLMSFIGLPAFNLRPAQERSEIWRRFYQLVDEVARAKAKK